MISISCLTFWVQIKKARPFDIPVLPNGKMRLYQPVYWYMQHGSRRYAERIEQNIINIENADMGKLLHGFKQYYHAYKYCGRYGKVMFRVYLPRQQQRKRRKQQRVAKYAGKEISCP